MEKFENWNDLEAAGVVELSSDDQKNIDGGYTTPRITPECFIHSIRPVYGVTFPRPQVCHLL